MAEPDDTPEPVAIEALPSSEQLEAEAMAALRLAMTSQSTPAAARVAAAKAILERLGEPSGNGSRTGESDPGTMDLDAINAELARLS